MLIWRWPSLDLFQEDRRLHPLSTPLSSRRSMEWCPWLCASMQRLTLFNTSDLPRRKPLVIVALPASLSARSFPFTPACPGQYIHRSFRRCQCIDTYASLGFLFRFVRMMACVVWLSNEREKRVKDKIRSVSNLFCCRYITHWVAFTTHGRSFTRRQRRKGRKRIDGGNELRNNYRVPRRPRTAAAHTLENAFSRRYIGRKGITRPARQAEREKGGEKRKEKGRKEGRKKEGRKKEGRKKEETKKQKRKYRGKKGRKKERKTKKERNEVRD